MPWQAEGATVDVQPDGTIKALALGPFRIVGRKGALQLDWRGIVLRSGWTMKITPENPTVHFGESVKFAVQVTDQAGREFRGAWFSIFPELGSDILRGPGLVSSTEGVEFKALAPGRCNVTGYMGQRSATTVIVIQDKEVGSDTRSPMGNESAAQPGIEPAKAQKSL